MNAQLYTVVHLIIRSPWYLKNSRTHTPIFKAMPACRGRRVHTTMPCGILRLFLTIGLCAMAGCGGGFLGDNPDASQMEKTIFDTHDADSIGR